MIVYRNCFFAEKELNEFAESFLSEVYPPRKQENKWRVYECHKKILTAICSVSEYGFAVKCLIDRLDI